MENLEKLLDKSQIREIALQFGAENWISNTTVSSYLNQLERGGACKNFISYLESTSIDEMTLNQQLDLRRFVLRNIESVLKTKFDSIREQEITSYTKKSIDSKKAKPLSYARFKNKLNSKTVKFIEKVYKKYERLQEKSDDWNTKGLTAKEEDELDQATGIIDNIDGQLGSSDDPGEDAEELIKKFNVDYNKRRNSPSTRARINRFIKYLNSIGLSAKSQSLGGLPGINTQKIVEYISSIKIAKEQEVINFLQNSNVNIPKLETMVYEYVFDGKPKNGGKLLDPYAIGQEFLIDFLKFGEKTLITNRQKDALAIAKQMILDKKFPGYDSIKAVLSKDKKIAMDKLAAIIKPAHNGEEYSDKFNTFTRQGTDFSGVYNTYLFIQADMIKAGLYLASRDMLVTDLLDGIGLLGEDCRKFYDDFKMFWTKFKPQEFDLQNLRKEEKIYKIEESYALAMKRDIPTLTTAVQQSGACLQGYNISAFTQDRATMNLIGYGPGNVPRGYARMFLASNNAGEPVIAVDTMEIGHKHFAENTDWVRVMGLAISQLCLDSNIRFAIGSEGRIAHGPRQGFGSKQIKTKIKKLGEPNFRLYDRIGTAPYTYRFDSDSGNYPGSSADYLMMLNWRRGNGSF